MRISRDQMFADIIKVIAQRGTCKHLRVGAILVKDNRIISTGYNGAPKGMPHCEEVGCQVEGKTCVRTAHAESNAIAFAARYGISTEGSTLYTTHSPCYTCAKLIINAGIIGIKYVKDYRTVEGIELAMAAGIEVDQITDWGITK